jgi:hypothetical protein
MTPKEMKNREGEEKLCVVRYFKNLCSTKCDGNFVDKCQLFSKDLKIEIIDGNETYKRCDSCKRLFR